MTRLDREWAPIFWWLGFFVGLLVGIAIGCGLAKKQPDWENCKFIGTSLAEHPLLECK